MIIGVSESENENAVISFLSWKFAFCYRTNHKIVLNTNAPHRGLTRQFKVTDSIHMAKITNEFSTEKPEQTEMPPEH
jgi:hypothetical protein